jgi:hypothetical protein
MAQQLSPLEQFLSNKLANEFRYVGSQIGKGNIPYGGKPRFSPEQMRGLTAPGLGNMSVPGSSGAPLNGIQTGKYGPTDWNPSANPLAAPTAPSLPPAERAYQQEKARSAQLTEQDPLFKKYQVADLTKAYNSAKTNEEKQKIGLQIWASTNPALAQKLKPGQTGYQEASELFGTQTFGTNQPGVTQAGINSLAETAGAPAMMAAGANYAAALNQPPNLGLGINAQQFAYSPQGEAAPEMIGTQAFSAPNTLNIPGIDETKRKLLIQAFNQRLK